MATEIQILHHGNCFDGIVSAALLTRFFLDGPYPGAQIRYRGMAHGARDPFGPDPAATFSAPVNAVVDFRYSPSPRLDWWCDHHESAFLRPEDRAHFEADRSGRKAFDPTAPSCAGLLARFLAERHGFDLRVRAPFSDHVRWADLIDGARFESPRQAVELEEPALQLMALLEAAPGDALCAQLARRLSAASLEEVHRDAEVQGALGPVLEGHRRTIAVFERRLVSERGVGSFDLSGDGVEGFNKMIPYHLDGSLRYTVGLTLSPRRAKVSVGSNPWRRPEPLVNLGELCGRYGGGGHAVVGAVTLPGEQAETARRAFREICELLRRS